MILFSWNEILNLSFIIFLSVYMIIDYWFSSEKESIISIYFFHLDYVHLLEYSIFSLRLSIEYSKYFMIDNSYIILIISSWYFSLKLILSFSLNNSIRFLIWLIFSKFLRKMSMILILFILVLNLILWIWKFIFHSIRNYMHYE